MNCSKCMEQLEEYIRGELDAGARTAVEDHLKECTACLMEFEETRDLIISLGRLPASLKIKEDILRMNRRNIIKKSMKESKLTSKLLPNIAAAVFFVAFAATSTVMAFPSFAAKYTPELPVIKQLVQIQEENKSVKQQYDEVKKQNEEIKQEVEALKIKLKEIDGTKINEVQTSKGIPDEENLAIQSLVLEFVKAQYRRDLEAVKSLCTDEFKKWVDQEKESILWRKNGEVIFSTITNVAKEGEKYLVFVRLNDTASEGEADYQENFELVKVGSKFLVSFVGNDA